MEADYLSACKTIQALEQQLVKQEVVDTTMQQINIKTEGSCNTFSDKEMVIGTSNSDKVDMKIKMNAKSPTKAKTCDTMKNLKVGDTKPELFSTVSSSPFTSSYGKNSEPKACQYTFQNKTKIRRNSECNEETQQFSNNSCTNSDDETYEAMTKDEIDAFAEKLWEKYSKNLFSKPNSTVVETYPP